MASPLAVKIYDSDYINNKFNHPMYTPVKRRKIFEQSVDSYGTRDILANSSHKENQNTQEITLSRVRK